jgi:hypothetical protein
MELTVLKKTLPQLLVPQDILDLEIFRIPIEILDAKFVIQEVCRRKDQMSAHLVSLEEFALVLAAEECLK